MDNSKIEAIVREVLKKAAEGQQAAHGIWLVKRMPERQDKWQRQT